ncbi:peptidoglycan-binding domain-containing protein, partial [Kitasatospora sp. NPDC057500]|uniref:peptidoglycan-binding domain-containing protein n=1 Tax=Kitasatospora sp. NPDC057500 TaxID=3346151 RepID=UPI0036CCAE8B
MGTKPNLLTRTLVGVTALAGIAVGSLAGATVGAAAPVQGPGTSVSARTTLNAVVNLGLSTTQAKYVQCYLKASWGYSGGIDGQLGTDSWKAMQRRLAEGYGYNGSIDGVVGSGTVAALQRRLADGWGYSGAIDGVAGPGTQAAFKSYANSLAST